MDPLASVSDLEARLGRTFAGDETTRALALLDDASALVRDVAGKTWINPDTGALQPVPGTIRWVVLRATERAVRNPDGFSSESAGDYSYQRVGVEPGVYLTEGEERAIRRGVGKTGLWTQPTTRGECPSHTVWFEDNFGLELFPLDVYYPDETGNC
jgi:Gp19/Gp15/Gp42-like protein